MPKGGYVKGPRVVCEVKKVLKKIVQYCILKCLN